MLHHLLFLLLCAIWGSSFILMKNAALAFGPLGVAGWRVAGGGAALACIWLLAHRRWTLSRRDVAPLVLVALAGSIWPYIIQPLVIHRYADSAFMGVVVSFVPLLTVLFSIPMLKIYPTRRQLLGVAGGLVFMVLLLGDGFLRHIALADLALAVTVPLSYAIAATFVMRRFAGYSPLVLGLAANGLSAVVLLPLSLGLETVPAGNHLTLAVLCVALLGILGTGFAIYIHFLLIQRRGPLFAGMVTYVVPIGAIAWGWWDGETITPLQIVALLGVLAMVALVQLGPRRSTASPLFPEIAAEVPPLALDSSARDR